MDIERNHIDQNNYSPNLCIKCIFRFLRLLRYLPFLLISSFYFWGLYCYLYHVVFQYYQQEYARALLLVVFLPLYILSFTCYAKCVLASHRPISRDFVIPPTARLDHMTQDELNSYFESLIQARNLPIFTRGFNGNVRFCTKCLVLKPDRAHHCSTCGKCICKMDHHCHWVSNCVAFDNYKFFILFLFYTALLCIFVVLTSLKLFTKFWNDNTYPGVLSVFFLVLFCITFAISICALLSYHLYLLILNMTTLETYQRPLFKQYEYDCYKFNLGCKRNLTSVFGENKFHWFLPIYNSMGDGHSYQLPLIPNVSNNADHKSHSTTHYDSNNGTTNHPTNNI